MDLGPPNFPLWTAVVAFIMGSAIGSFLNVVIYRLPRGLSIAKPKHSFCPSCGHQLETLDLIPLLSWLFLKGKCRHCQTSVSSRYFVVELITATLWAAIYYVTMVQAFDPVKFFAYAGLVSCLVAVIFIDWQYYIIPDQVNAAALIIGLIFNGYLIATHKPGAYVGSVPSAIAGGILGVAVMWGIAFLGRILFRKDAMGHGDIKLARGIGAVLFPTSALVSFGLAVALGAVLGLLQVVLRPRAKANEGEDDDDDEEYVPESIGSLLKCGLGYLFCLDVIGLLVPKFYISWFGEDPYEPVVVDGQEKEFQAGFTMIPFGPYLAAGAIAACLFQTRLDGLVNEYWKFASGGVIVWEHIFR